MTLPLKHARASGSTSVGDEASPSSSKAVGLDALPSADALRTWVHRPHAVACCFITDVVRLRTLAYTDGGVSQAMRDVFLLDQFPCRFVKVVAWVAGVVHKESSMTVTLDEGNGEIVLEAAIRLTQLELPKKGPHRRPEGSTWKERRAARVAALPPQLEETALFIRPDIRVGDTVRVVGRVEEWMRGGRDWVRQLAVDEGGGVCSIVVVDPEEEYAHISAVRALHRDVYSQPFTMPAVASTPTPGPSPSKSILSSVASDYDDDDEDYDVGTELPDAAELSSSRLTETTFKLYALDHMTRETARVMRALRALNAEHSRSYGSLGSFLAGPIPALAALFPEYRVATAGFSQPVNSLGSSRNMNRNSDNKDDTPGDATPRASGFRTNSERQAARLGDATPKASHRSPPESQPQDRLAPYTIPTLLVTPRLRDLAVRIVDARARNEEKHRRRREKLGTSTARDAKIVASRIARGLDAGAYKLSCTERKAKMSALAAWAIQQAHAEGGLVDVRVPTTGDTWGAPETAYLPLPPELLAPLLAPLVSAAHADARGTFRSRLERAGAAPEVSPQAVTARLRAWGADGRWERVGAWAVEAAMEWGEAHGVI